jgi:predicted TIM-barrel fold metal-dependent hydrolase
VTDQPVIDAHQHVVRLDSLAMPVDTWAPPAVTRVQWRDIYDGDVPDPPAFVAFLDDQGVDVALLMSEHSPRVTGMQRVEHLLPLVEHAPERLAFIASINPHLHFPAVAELDRQVSLGAVACKIHAVHGDFDPARRDLYLVYARCVELGLPVVFHCGTSNFPGANNARADVASLGPIVSDFPDLDIVLAHGGRGWSYDAAAWFALTYPNVWIELSGLPPSRLTTYYAAVGFERLAPRCIFGTDFPGAPSIAGNIEKVRGLGLDSEVLADVMWRNAVKVYAFDRAPGLAATVAGWGT